VLNPRRPSTKGRSRGYGSCGHSTQPNFGMRDSGRRQKVAISSTKRSILGGFLAMIMRPLLCGIVNKRTGQVQYRHIGPVPFRSPE